jgi:broad specificity phosphatase PhoE
MKANNKRKPYRLLLLMILALLTLSACSASKIYIVRHAEKAVQPANDPILTTDGERRADALKEALKDASIDVIIVSDLQRTQLTAQPLATHLGLEPIIIAVRPPSNANQYVQNVVNEINANWKGRDILVVSHNSLLQQIAQNLGSPEIGTISEETGYDNFFVIIKPRDSINSKFVRLRYGQPPKEVN